MRYGITFIGARTIEKSMIAKEIKEKSYLDLFLNIKCFIFDQDGTLYPEKSPLTNALRRATKRWIANRLCLNKKEVEVLYENLKKKYPNALEGFQSLGLSVYDYHENVFNKINLKKYISKDKRLIYLFKKLKGKKFIVTFSSLKYSTLLQKMLGVYKFINKTYSLIDFLPKTSKLYVYEFIRKKYNLSRNEICIIGNNWKTDIVPALNIGYNCIFIGKCLKKNKKLISIPTIYDLIKII